ncbi:MAG: SixA phosphatase family protein [Acidithiobacillus sp.]
MEILFIRHAEAEDARAAGGDYERALTARGRRDAAMLADRLSKLLPPGPIHLCYSPLRRTRETAEPIEQKLPLQGSEPQEAIAQGDLEILERHWQGLATLAAAVIVVGHQPHLGQWIESITGARIGVSKASVTCLRWDGLRQRGELLAHLRTEVLERLPHGD